MVKKVVLLPKTVVESKDKAELVEINHEGQRWTLLQSSKGGVQVWESVRPRFASLCCDIDVIADGTLHTALPFDPLFLALPALHAMKKGSLFHLVDDVLSDPAYPGVARFTESIKERIGLICDIKGSGDYVACQLNEDKLMTLLRKKVLSVARALSLSPASAKEEAVRVVCDCVCEPFKGRLLERYGFSSVKALETALKKKRGEIEEESRPNKADAEEGADGKKRAATFGTSGVQAKKKVAKASTKGMKSMMAYFGKK
mmetsp:Transcript_40721/g.105697  ORF Transcript_40721/g.105697 Transcript_40721/m.105697 type:complete len:258 (-) Transcript_40721:82-855(-)